MEDLNEPAENKEDEQKAREILERKFQENKQKCWKEVADVLNKYKLSFDISTIINSDGRITHRLDLIPRR
jgi:Skp family chaperone for outer membrane proteins